MLSVRVEALNEDGKIILYAKWNKIPDKKEDSDKQDDKKNNDESSASDSSDSEKSSSENNHSPETGDTLGNSFAFYGCALAIVIVFIVCFVRFMRKIEQTSKSF